LAELAFVVIAPGPNGSIGFDHDSVGWGGGDTNDGSDFFDGR
jgi:dipeptidyl aminopeptidase/acylaminoacyl peptidase